MKGLISKVLVMKCSEFLIAEFHEVITEIFSGLEITI